MASQTLFWWMMHLNRNESELDGRDLHYWRTHFFSRDSIEEEEAIMEATRQCTTWDEALAVARSLPWPVDPELYWEGDVPYRINNFFSSGDQEAADIMLDAAWDAHLRGVPWLEIIQIVTSAEKTWRHLQRTKNALSHA